MGMCLTIEIRVMVRDCRRNLRGGSISFPAWYDRAVRPRLCSLESLYIGSEGRCGRWDYGWVRWGCG